MLIGIDVDFLMFPEKWKLCRDAPLLVWGPAASSNLRWRHPPRPPTSSAPPQAQSATDSTHRQSSAAEPFGSWCVSKATEAFRQVGRRRPSWTWRRLPTGGSSPLFSRHALAPASSRAAGRARRDPDHGAEQSESPPPPPLPALPPVLIIQLLSTDEVDALAA